jgi:DNA-binding SARP family transcriptional activator
MHWRLTTLGTVDLRSDTSGLAEGVVAQQKRFGLLAYLASARPFGFHQRDVLLALFWPTLATMQARRALRQALHFLRHVLGEDAIVNRGESVGLSDRVWCDVREFDRALNAGAPDEALSLYRGDFLDAFHVSDASSRFEHWLDAERAFLRERAVMAAWQLAERDESRGEKEQAAKWAQRAAALHATNEHSIQKLIELLGRHGDRRGAMRAYESFAKRLEQEYQVQPSPETTQLIETVRHTSRPAG